MKVILASLRLIFLLISTTSTVAIATDESIRLGGLTTSVITVEEYNQSKKSKQNHNHDNDTLRLLSKDEFATRDTGDKCADRRVEIANSIQLIKDISFTGDLLGFLLPFVTIGSIGVILAICLFFAIPSGEYEKKEECSKIKKKKLTWLGVIEVYHKINEFCIIKKTR